MVNIINKVKSMFEGNGGDMEIHKVLVTGFPHSGTSIMRAVLGNVDGVYAHPFEATMVTEKMAKKAKQENASRVVVKWPWNRTDFFDAEHEVFGEYKKIFVIRSPYYTYSSLNDIKSANEPHTRLGDWQKAAQYWIALNESDRKDMICVKYEDLFLRDYTGMREVISKVGITEYNHNAYRENETYTHQIDNFKAEDVKSVPRAGIEHSKYRLWQMKQPFKSTNGPARLNLTKEQIREISSMVETTVLGYSGQVICDLLKTTR